ARLRMASPLNQPERIRRFDETGGAQFAHRLRAQLRKAGTRSVSCRNRGAGREMYGRLHFRQTGATPLMTSPQPPKPDQLPRRSVTMSGAVSLQYFPARAIASSVASTAMRVHLGNPSHISFGIGVITPRW